MAQPDGSTPRVDAEPIYQIWQQEYTLKKIQYTPQKTIFHCQWRCDNAYVDGILLPTTQEPYAWYLQDVKADNLQYDMLGVYNVQRNGVLVLPGFLDEAFTLSTAGRQGITIFHFEVHFPRIRRETDRVHLIAGRGEQYNRNHFNCFSIQLHRGKAMGTVIAEHPANTEPVDTPALAVVLPPPSVDPAPTPIVAPALPCGEPLVLEGLRFLDNQPTLDARFPPRPILKKVVDHLRAYPEATATLIGHTDVFGDPKANLNLSEQRAKAIRQLLVDYGIRAERLSCLWYGSKRPLFPEGSARNRRVEIQLQCN